MRGCYFNPASCFGAFVELPIADAEAYDSRQWRAATSTPLGNGGGDGAQVAARSVDVSAGVRYSSPAFSAGVMGSPLDGSVNALWMVCSVCVLQISQSPLRHHASTAVPSVASSRQICCMHAYRGQSQEPNLCLPRKLIMSCPARWVGTGQ